MKGIRQGIAREIRSNGKLEKKETVQAKIRMSRGNRERSERGGEEVEEE